MSLCDFGGASVLLIDERSAAKGFLNCVRRGGISRGVPEITGELRLSVTGRPWRRIAWCSSTSHQFVLSR